jgi:olfactory receptor
MAYNCYVAICHPLSYTLIMKPYLCCLLILFSLLISIVTTLILGFMVPHLSFCIDIEIPNFFCELAQVIKLACSNTINNILAYIATFIFGNSPISGIILF